MTTQRAVGGFTAETCGRSIVALVRCATAHQLAIKQTVICVANAARMGSGAKRTGTRFATPRRASCT